MTDITPEWIQDAKEEAAKIVSGDYNRKDLLSYEDRWHEPDGPANVLAVLERMQELQRQVWPDDETTRARLAWAGEFRLDNPESAQGSVQQLAREHEELQADRDRLAVELEQARGINQAWIRDWEAVAKAAGEKPDIMVTSLAGRISTMRARLKEEQQAHTWADRVERRLRMASSYNLDAAYCPSCGSPLREHTNDDCGRCGYQMGVDETWLTLREMIEGKAGEYYPMSDEVNLPLFARIVAEAVGREKNDV